MFNYSKLARENLKNPCAIRRVEEASRIQPITHDDVVNLRISLETCKTVLSFIDVDDTIANNEKRDYGRDRSDDIQCLNLLQ